MGSFTLFLVSFAASNSNHHCCEPPLHDGGHLGTLWDPHGGYWVLMGVPWGIWGLYWGSLLFFCFPLLYITNKGILITTIVNPLCTTAVILVPYGVPMGVIGVLWGSYRGYEGPILFFCFPLLYITNKGTVITTVVNPLCTTAAILAPYGIPMGVIGFLWGSHGGYGGSIGVLYSLSGFLCCI